MPGSSAHPWDLVWFLHLKVRGKAPATASDEGLIFGLPGMA